MEFSKKEVELFEKIKKLYEKEPTAAIALLNEDQLDRFEEYLQSTKDYKKIYSSYLEEVYGGDSDGE